MGSKIKVVRVVGQVSEAAYEWDTYEQDKATFGADPGSGEVVIGEWEDRGYTGMTYRMLDVGEARHPLYVDEDGLWVVADEPGVDRKLVGKRFTDVWMTREKIDPPRRRFLIHCQKNATGGSRWYGTETTPGRNWFKFGWTRDEVCEAIEDELRAA